MKQQCVLILVLAAGAVAVPLPSLESWLSDVLPQKPGSSSVQTELQCYSLPYGGIGFASHILTYWAVISLAFNRRPFNPWKKLENSVLDLGLSTGSVIVSVLLAILNIVHCRNSWQFLVIAVWKTTMSFTLGMVGLHRAYQLTQAKATGFSAWWWLTVYGLGTIVGLSGVLSLVDETYSTVPAVRTITYVFGGIVGFAGVGVIIAAVLLAVFDKKSSRTDIFAVSSVIAVLVPLGVFGVLAAFYSDWILAAIADDGWAGAPSDDNKWLYWTYFVAKRIPLFAS